MKTAKSLMLSMLVLSLLTSPASGSDLERTPALVAAAEGRVSDFYRWTSPLPRMPGVMLRTEPLERAMWVPETGEGQRILYSSTDGMEGKRRIAVSGALFVPQGKPPAGGWPVVAWGHGTVGIADACAPSWAGRSWRDMRYLSTWLRQGFAVVATDYQGLGTPGPHPYLATRPVGYSLIDSARAAIRMRRDLSNRILFVGQSQGGAAVLAAAGLAPSYAPDLHVIGTVATGTGVLGGIAPPPAPGNPEVDATSAYGLYLAIALAAFDPDVRVEDVVSATAMPLLPQAATRCIDPFEFDMNMAGLNWTNIFRPEALAILGRHAALLNAPTPAIPTPVFLGTGARDIDVDPALQRALARRMCAAGTQVSHHVYPDLDHSGALNASLADSLPFVRRLLAGEPVADTCAAGA